MFEASSSALEEDFMYRTRKEDIAYFSTLRKLIYVFTLSPAEK